MVHQRALDGVLSVSRGGYGARSGCVEASVVGAAVTIFTPGTTASTSLPLSAAVLPVDVAVSPGGVNYAVALPGSANAARSPGSFTLGPVSDIASGSLCPPSFSTAVPNLYGQVTSVAYDALGHFVTQSREPARLDLFDTHGSYLTGVSPSPVSRYDTGHDLFHTMTPASIACASCHPEAGDDGRTWDIGAVGRRRTQVIRGGLLGTEPFHWDGDQVDFPHLMDDVFVNRMAGPMLSPEQTRAVASWVNAQPNLPVDPPTDVSAVARGQSLFNDPIVGCSGCHSGAKLTNNQTMDVGTGGMFQVPSLRGVRWRPPYLHSGCAPTLRDRFGACGGGDLHGHTSVLATEQIDDLVAYLQSL
jgi:mono/diheme cytochrome c family protein